MVVVAAVWAGWVEWICDARSKRVLLTKVRIQVASKKGSVDYSAETVRMWWEFGFKILSPDPSFQENRMAKGQQRSNREQKKPKQSKLKAAVPGSPFAVTQVKPAAPIPEKKK
jgi:hypothetical protein